MSRIKLDTSTHADLQALRDQDLPAKVRDRLEMVFLADAGWGAASIAAHLGYNYRPALDVLKDFLARGPEALTPRRPGPPPDAARRERNAGLIRGLLAEDRTRTSAQIADALRAKGRAILARQVRRHMQGMKSRYRRTTSSVKHKQAPAKAARAGVALGHLVDRAESGMIELFYLDECRFAPLLPTGYSWCLPGQRKFVRYEYPQGRRVNVLAAYNPFGPAPRLTATTFGRTLSSGDLLEYLRALPAASVPRVVVLDNAGMHTSKAVKAERKELAGRGIFLYYLPAYSPELNRIEPVFKQIKHHEIPHRSHESKSELTASVEGGFESYWHKLDQRSGKELRPGA